MLLRSNDPFRDLDRLAAQLFGSSTRPVSVPVDAWRAGDTFHLELDLPGVSPDSIEVNVERNVLTIRAERTARNGDWQLMAAERPHGAFSRQLVLGDNLDLDQLEATYDDGVLRVAIPVAERAKPRKIEVRTARDHEVSRSPEPAELGT